MNPFFSDIKKNFGFGLMRLPMIGEDVDIEQTKAMVDAFLKAGFNYFDTAHPYIQGKSELAVKECLSSRYPRDSFILTNKLSFWCFEKEEDIRPLFQTQLDACGVEYFDFYLHHALSGDRHQKYLETNAYEIVKELKAEGKVRHIGMSFHDTAEALDKILTDRPEIEVVQLQINYVDWIDPRVQAEQCYEVCVKHNKPVIVMEPVKGGSLVNLPQEAAEMLPDYSQAGYAIRFAASPENVFMVLSGMSNTDQMADNIATMADFKPFSEAEYETIHKVRTIYQGQNRIPCTGCRYCVDGCPAGILIPDVFTAFNDSKSRKEDVAAQGKAAYEAFEHKAHECIGCGQCENACPQFLEIRQLLEAVAKAF